MGSKKKKSRVCLNEEGAVTEESQGREVGAVVQEERKRKSIQICKVGGDWTGGAKGVLAEPKRKTPGIRPLRAFNAMLRGTNI